MVMYRKIYKGEFRDGGGAQSANWRAGDAPSEA